MLTKTLIINVNIGKQITRYDDCSAANIVLTEYVKRSIYEICEFLAFDSSKVTVGYKALTCSVDLYDGYTSGLSECNLEALTIPVNQFVEQTLSLHNRPRDPDVDLSDCRMKINFNVIFIASGTIFVTCEVFEQ